MTIRQQIIKQLKIEIRDHPNPTRLTLDEILSEMEYNNQGFLIKAQDGFYYLHPVNIIDQFNLKRLFQEVLRDK